MRIQQKRSQELQEKAKNLYRKGLNNKQIAKELNVQPKTVGSWLKQFKTDFAGITKMKTLLIQRINKALSDPNTKTSEIKDLFTSLTLYKKTEIG
jgi:uncharacterized protein YjcR